MPGVPIHVERWDVCNLKEVVSGQVLGVLPSPEQVAGRHCYGDPLIFMGPAFSDTVACLSLGRGHETHVQY